MIFYYVTLIDCLATSVLYTWSSRLSVDPQDRLFLFIFFSLCRFHLNSLAVFGVFETRHLCRCLFAGVWLSVCPLSGPANRRGWALVYSQDEGQHVPLVLAISVVDFTTLIVSLPLFFNLIYFEGLLHVFIPPFTAVRLSPKIHEHPDVCLGNSRLLCSRRPSPAVAIKNLGNQLILVTILS